MKSLRWVGPVFSLLIVGVLGGLMAPLSSEASSTKLTLQVDSGSPVSILGGTGTCPSGYNRCFLVSSTPVAFGSNNRGYNVSVAPGTSVTAPKLLINDTSASDAFKFAGVKIAPTSTSSWPNTEIHVVKVVMEEIFDGSPNGSGNYVVALRTGGYLQAAGTAPIYTQYDWLEFKGTGTFSPSLVDVNLLNTANPNPLKLQVANQASATYFTLNQVVTYPTFGCDADGASSGTQCKPKITLTMTITFYGPDFVVLTASNEAIFGGPCKLTPADPGITEPTGNPIPCHASGKKKNQDEIITAQITENNNTDITESIADGVTVAAVQCTDADNCPCADPNTCFGTIVINLKVTPNTAGTFNVTGTGDGIGTPNPATPTIYPIITKANGRGSLTFNNLPLFGAPWVIAEGPFTPIDGQHVWESDQINCVSQLNDPSAIPPIIVSTWTVNSGPDKSPLTVTQLGNDKLTCEWHVHQTSIN